MKDHFQQLRRNLELNDTFKEIIQTRHSAVRSVIENNDSSIRETKLIGSLQRQTRIQPRPNDGFDIDILVVLGEFSNWVSVGGVTPAQALANVHSSVRESDRYAAKNPQQDSPTVTLDFADRVKVELVPAYIDNIGVTPNGESVPPKGRGYWVPNNGRWEHADYDFEADYITEKNRVSDGWLVPAIKMLKAIRREYFPQLRSFPLEIISAQTIPIIVAGQKSRGLQISSPELLEIFFGVVKETVSPSLKIPGSNSPPVIIDAVTIESIKNTFGAIERHITSINRSTTQAEKIEGWRKLFGECFPTRV
jgi:hypothetical protein